MDTWERPSRIFLHFFDTHFLEVKTSGSLLRYVRDECRLATRFSVLAAEQVLIPAASFFESKLCRSVLGELEPLFETGIIWLVGSGMEIREYIEDKRRQYGIDSAAHQCYFAGLPRAMPPFLSRKGSATRDIASRWRDCLEIPGKIDGLLDGTRVAVPGRFEDTWNDLPDLLGEQAFIVNHVEPILFPGENDRTIRNRLHSVINPAYFESFTREYGAGIVTELVYLEAPHPVPSSGINLPYRRLRDECRRRALLEGIVTADAGALEAMRHEQPWVETLAACISVESQAEVIHGFHEQVARSRTEGISMQPQPLKSFIVHGHDETTRLALKNYLQNTLHWPEPTILMEKPSGGLTVIEKFEEYSKDTDVVFVLMTPDDEGGAKGGELAARARQNVVFELGYFVGQLGRKSGRVLLLHKGALEMPSDLAGVIFIDISGGVKAAGEHIRQEVSGLGPLS